MDNPQTETKPQRLPDTEVLQHIAALATEHFDDVLIVVTRGKERYDFFTSEDGAHGKAAFISSKISRRWWSEKLEDLK